MDRTKSGKYIGKIYITPALLIVAVVMLFPLVYNIIQSFFEVTIFTDGWRFIGFEQYADLLTDGRFLNALRNTFVWTIFSVLFQFVFGFLCALALSQDKIRFRGILRALIMLSWVLPGVIGAMVWRWMYHTDFGILNEVLVAIGIIAEPLPWVGSTQLALPAAIIVNVWKMFPLVLLYIEAALQSVPVELHQAAAVDGAGAWQRFRVVTWPHVRNTCKTIVLLLTIWTLNSFTFIFILTEGGPGTASQVLSLFIHREAFRNFNFGRASAASTVLFLIVGLFSIVYIRSTMKRSDEN